MVMLIDEIRTPQTAPLNSLTLLFGLAVQAGLSATLVFGCSLRVEQAHYW